MKLQHTHTALTEPQLDAVINAIQAIGDDLDTCDLFCSRRGGRLFVVETDGDLDGARTWLIEAGQARRVRSHVELTLKLDEPLAASIRRVESPSSNVIAFPQQLAL